MFCTLTFTLHWFSSPASCFLACYLPVSRQSFVVLQACIGQDGANSISVCLWLVLCCIHWMQGWKAHTSLREINCLGIQFIITRLWITNINNLEKYAFIPRWLTYAFVCCIPLWYETHCYWFHLRFVTRMTWQEAVISVRYRTNGTVVPLPHAMVYCILRLATDVCNETNSQIAIEY